jgi:hypothetical protein
MVESKSADQLSHKKIPNDDTHHSFSKSLDDSLHPQAKEQFVFLSIVSSKTLPLLCRRMNSSSFRQAVVMT